jgi:penicillin-binding protein 2
MKSSGRSKELRENAWFVGFAPRDNPEIVVSALFEHGEHGQYAAAIVRDVIKAYFDKKARLEAMRQEKERMVGALSMGLVPGSPTATAKPPAGGGEIPVAVVAAEVPATDPKPRPDSRPPR